MSGGAPGEAVAWTPRDHGLLGVASVFGLAFTLQGLGLLACRAARLPGSDRLAIGVEATVRNVNLAILVKASVFPAVTDGPDPVGDGMRFVALLYGGGALLAAAPPVLWHRRRGEPWRSAADAAA